MLICQFIPPEKLNNHNKRQYIAYTYADAHFNAEILLCILSTLEYASILNSLLTLITYFHN